MKKLNIKSAFGWLKQFLLLIAIFILISWWQQKDMLPSSAQFISPAFSLPSINGEIVQFNLSPFNIKQPNKKMTLLYFFAPWCGICHASIDNVEAIKRSYNNEINIYIIALDWQDKSEVENFLSQHKLTVPVLLGEKQTSNDYKIKGFPSYYIVDKNGLIKSRSMGYSTELGLRARLLSINF